MARSELTYRMATSRLLFGSRDPLPLHPSFSLKAESEISSDLDESAVSGPWRGDDKGDHREGEVDPRVPKIMEDVMRYIRSIDVNTL
jgi:hypothetical protein